MWFDGDIDDMEDEEMSEDFIINTKSRDKISKLSLQNSKKEVKKKQMNAPKHGFPTAKSSTKGILYGETELRGFRNQKYKTPHTYGSSGGEISQL